MRRYPYQHMHVIAVDRSRVDRHLQTSRYLSQQLPCSLSYFPYQHRISILRYQYKVVFTVPNRVATRLIILHSTILFPSPKGEGFTDPRWGTLNGCKQPSTASRRSAEQRVK